MRNLEGVSHMVNIAPRFCTSAAKPLWRSSIFEYCTSHLLRRVAQHVVAPGLPFRTDTKNTTFVVQNSRYRIENKGFGTEYCARTRYKGPMTKLSKSDGVLARRHREGFSIDPIIRPGEVRGLFLARGGEGRETSRRLAVARRQGDKEREH